MEAQQQSEQQKAYAIKTPQFEGPLDLLLSLIEKRKLFINEISLAKIADDYIAHIRELGSFPISESAHFILIASTLVLIKSRSLLPSLPLTTEEEGSIKNLEDRLKAYQRIRGLSIHLKERFGAEPEYFPNARPQTPVFAPDAAMTGTNLLAAIKSAINSIPKPEHLPKAVVKKMISLEEMIGNLTSRIKSTLKMSFRDFAGVGKHEKVHVIVSFLAMLELVKQGMVQVRQERDFDDITIETNDLQVPNYQ